MWKTLEHAEKTGQDCLLLIYGTLSRKIKKQLAVVREKQRRSVRRLQAEQAEPVDVDTIRARERAAHQPVSVLDFVREQEDEERLERLVYGPEGVLSGQPDDSREKERLRILWSVLSFLCGTRVMATDSPT
jgi:hypothetical protein